MFRECSARILCPLREGGRLTSGLLDRINLGAVFSVMLRLVMNPEGCAECLWHVEMWANTQIMVGPANWHYYLV